MNITSIEHINIQALKHLYQYLSKFKMVLRNRAIMNDSAIFYAVVERSKGLGQANVNTREGFRAMVCLQSGM